MAAAVVAAGASLPAAHRPRPGAVLPAAVLPHRPYAPNGTPWANGKQDYLKLVNERDGGINGVKIRRMRNRLRHRPRRGMLRAPEEQARRGPVDPQATGITFALTERPRGQDPADHAGLRPVQSRRTARLQVELPCMGSYWTGADILIQHIGKKEGGLDKLKGKKIALVYHDSPFGKEPIPLLQSAPRCTASSCSCCP
jgi:branched-chain amino acid transport system substrate-binding protein